MGECLYQGSPDHPLSSAGTRATVLSARPTAKPRLSRSETGQAKGGELPGQAYWDSRRAGRAAAGLARRCGAGGQDAKKQLRTQRNYLPARFRPAQPHSHDSTGRRPESLAREGDSYDRRHSPRMGISCHGPSQGRCIRPPTEGWSERTASPFQTERSPWSQLLATNLSCQWRQHRAGRHHPGSAEVGAAGILSGPGPSAHRECRGPTWTRHGAQPQHLTLAGSGIGRDQGAQR